MSKKNRIEKLIVRLNKRYKPETKIVILRDGETDPPRPDPETLYIRIVPESYVNME